MEIGADSLVSAGSIVIKDVPPGVLVCGNPAAVVKRFDAEIGSEAKIAGGVGR